MCNGSIYFYIIYKVKNKKYTYNYFFCFFAISILHFFVLLLVIRFVDQIGKGGLANIDCVKLSEVVASQTSFWRCLACACFAPCEVPFLPSSQQESPVLAVGLAMAIRLVILRRLLHSVVEGVECLLVHTFYTVHTIHKKYFNLFLLQPISRCRF